MRLFITFLFLFQMIHANAMDNPYQSLDAMKKRIEGLKQQKEATRVFAEQRMQELQQKKLALQRNIINEQAADNCLHDYLQILILQGASLALEKATRFGYDYFKKEDSTVDESTESFLSFFSCINQIVCHPHMLKSLMDNCPVKRRIFCHRVSPYIATDELKKLTNALKNETEQKRSLTMQIIDECFVNNPTYNDSLVDRLTFATIGTILLLPAMAADVSKTAISYLGLKK